MKASDRFSSGLLRIYEFSKCVKTIPWNDMQLSDKNRECDLHFSENLTINTDTFIVVAGRW